MTKRTIGRLGMGVLGALGLAGCAIDDAPDAGAIFDGAERAFPGETGELRTGLVETPYGPREMTYELLHGWAVVEGDILLHPAGTGPRGVSRTRGTYRWPGGVVPYDIDPLLTDQFRVTDAIAHWEAETNVDFVIHAGEPDYITFRPSTGCSSSVGQVGGQQFINLATGCSTGNTIHEIGHALGLWHEQARADRDDHIIVNLANVTPGYETNFYTFAQRGEDGRDIGPYDLESIMHYGSYSFSDNGLPTITELDGSIIVANRTAVTETDVCTVNRFLGWGNRSDINDDGYADLVIGVPNENVTAGGDDGAIQVLFGSATGLTDTNQWLHRNAAGVEDVAAAGDHFGYAVALGDYNGDCLADAAIGVPGDDVGALVDAGSVHVFYGTILGLGLGDDAVWHLDSLNVVGDAAANEEFGTALSRGDFNGDGYDDLAVGIPYLDIGLLTDTGSVTILYGSATGLTGTGSQLWNQNTGTVQDGSESGDHAGWSVESGDLDGDGFDELIFGAPDEDVGAVANAGVVHVLYGTIDGLDDVGNQMWVEDNGSVPDTSEANDLFGFAVASDDFDSDGYGDLAIGVPLEDLAAADAGSVTVMYGTATGLLATGSEQWNQDTAGIQEVAEASDVFGRSLEPGDFDDDGYPDLAIGAPYEDVVAVNSAGAFQIIMGGSTGLTDVGDQLFTQDTAGVLDAAEAGDTFGFRLRAGDFDGDAHADLAVATPNESVGAIGTAGAIHELLGGAAGVTTVGSAQWHQDTLTLQDTCEAGDQFGWGL